MTVETAAAILLFICITLFLITNLHNILVVHKRKSNTKAYAETKLPLSLIISLGAIGTLAYFLEALTYMALVFINLSQILHAPTHYFQLPFTFHMQVLGLVLTVLGYFLFIWSVIARGKYATSWGMPQNHKLVTWGPYHYVRHPSYLGYFLMFFGLFFLWSSLITLAPLMAIAGYYRVAVIEEELLLRRFGDEYLEYQKKTGRFIPKLWRRK